MKHKNRTKKREKAPRRLKVAIICLHILSAFYLTVGVALPFALAGYGALRVLLGVGFIVIAAGSQAVIWGLKRAKSWAWTFGIIICLASIPGLAVVPGAVGLWGLLSPQTRALFPASTKV